MKFINTTYRTKKPEIMDDFDLKGRELKKTLEDLDKINTWLGGNKITIEGIKKVLKEKPSKEQIKIADIGCGNGTMLKEIAVFGRKKNLQLELTGIDGNAHAIEIARKNTTNYPEISFKTMNVFSENFQTLKFDLILCTLTLHHFTDEQVEELLKNFLEMSTWGVVINDLQRSKIAYCLFEVFCAIFINNEIARKDGLTSILRGFKRNELKKHSEKMIVENYEISWKWAFRYQWILFKTEPG